MQVARYIVNGLVATVVHFAVLSFNVEVLDMHSAGLANFIAALVGMSISFFGSRHYVFRAAHAPVLPQAFAFVLLYASLAAAHGLILYLWTDRAGLDYRLGFLVATAFQVSISYLGNKTLVFKP
jgi:putative flippase GtrA